MRAFAIQYDGTGCLVAESGFVDAFCGQSIIDVGQCRDAAAERNLLPSQSLGIAASVETLMVRPCDVAGHVQEMGLWMGLCPGVKRLPADRGVLLHRLELVRAQPSWFEQHAVGDSHFADIVERARQVDHLNEVAINLVAELFPGREFVGQDAAILSHPLQVHTRFRISAFGQFGQSEDGDIAAFQRQNSFANFQADSQLVRLERFRDEIIRTGVISFNDVFSAAARRQ